LVTRVLDIFDRLETLLSSELNEALKLVNFGFVLFNFPLEVSYGTGDVLVLFLALFPL
jgi:hypothetical protein